jgi:hypothetical protein
MVAVGHHDHGRKPANEDPNGVGVRDSTVISLLREQGYFFVALFPR